MFLFFQPQKSRYDKRCPTATTATPATTATASATAHAVIGGQLAELCQQPVLTAAARGATARVQLSETRRDETTLSRSRSRSRLGPHNLKSKSTKEKPKNSPKNTQLLTVSLRVVVQIAVVLDGVLLSAFLLLPLFYFVSLEFGGSQLFVA